MIKKESYEILENIKANYKRFDINQTTIDLWHKFLKDYEYEKIYENLMTYIGKNKFAPVIADLIEQPKEYTSRAIPNVEETAAYLREMENRIDDAPEGTKAEAQKKIREILGLDNDRQ